MFTPTRPGTAHGALTLQGTGTPLTAQMRPVGFALPAVTRLSASGERRGCATTPGAPVSVTVSQGATVHWTLARAAGGGKPGSCPRTGARTGRVVAAGTVRTQRHSRTHTARWRLPAGAAPGGYVLTAYAVNDHGAGPSRAMAVRLIP